MGLLICELELLEYVGVSEPVISVCIKSRKTTKHIYENRNRRHANEVLIASTTTHRILQHKGMGRSQSKEHPPPSPPSSPLLQKPWRELEWNKRDELIDHLRRFQISNPDVKHLRILVYGPVGAGKSSFINSIDSIFQGRMTSGAIAEACAGHSFTRIYKTHKIKDGEYGSHLPFVISDVMGLERGDSEGVQTKDLTKILKGHTKEGYVFYPPPRLPEKDKDYNKAPGLSDRIHCLVSVIPADTLLWCADSSKISDHAMREKDEAFIQKMKDVRAYASMIGIPQIAILSKVDEACPEVQNDIKMIYRSKIIREKVLKNYHEENRLNDDMDVLLLSALKEILNFANDHVAEMKREERHNSLCFTLQGKMGLFFSNQLPPPADPESPLMDNSWCEVNWEQNQTMMKDSLRTLQIRNPEVQHLRILVVGPAGAGKSSFIHSMRSILQNQMLNSALTVASTSVESFTTTYTTSRFEDDRGRPFPFVTSDVMGLEPGKVAGVQPEDIVNTLRGHIKEGYTFNPRKPCSERDTTYWNSNPSLSDMVHCLVFVMSEEHFILNCSTDQNTNAHNILFQRLEEIRRKASDLMIPQIAILTKVDVACPTVKKDIKLIYKSKSIFRKAQACSHALGVPMSCIFPVKNYHMEKQLNPDVDAVLLFTLGEILRFANACEGHQ
ncbi:uncharacterized protein LOC134079129 [Sardina pilchardus]|uniref:uncharacterized protein LOC134079129 n=1 Tax=Sardina pilchardus TaxID=27697 RepID=UPI002E0F92F9